MIDEFLESALKKLKDKRFFDDLIINRGIEKEFFRVSHDGKISKKSHPESLGSALTNKFITTDFAEAQIELVTPVFQNIDELYNFLLSLHVYVSKNINKKEIIWPFSMPPAIENEADINLGYYHKSNIGLLKHVYRKGLRVRYGSIMQCVSGMHYNFSLDTSSLEKLTNDKSRSSLDEAYLGLIRNFKRMFWFVLSEFGQTNIVDKSFVKNRSHRLDKLNDNDMYLKYATSLRMSDIGYVSDAQRNLNIKYNSLDGFLRKIKDAITVPYSEFQQKKLKDADGEYHQISDGIIQIENEYYDSIRPKRSSFDSSRPYDLLKKNGIEYLEIRGIDIDPHELTGISKHHIALLDLILIYCLIIPSPKISKEEKLEIDKNDEATIYEGRNEGTRIFYNSEYRYLVEEKENIYESLEKLASFFKDSNDLIQSIDYVKNYKKGEIGNDSFQNVGIMRALSFDKKYKSFYNLNTDGIEKEAELSLDLLGKIPINSEQEMNEYIKNYNMRL